MKTAFKRVYHNHLKCEEFMTNMWKDVPIDNRENMVILSKELLSDCDKFYDACLEVVANWTYSCEANLTATNNNHQAWFGAAACAINHNCPEYLVRLAWRELTEKQQFEANLMADKAKQVWMEKYRRELCPSLF